MKRWIAAIAGLLCMLGPGVLYSFSLISTPLTAAFGWKSGDVVWAFALANFFLAIGGLVGGIFVDRIGSRPIAVIGVILWSAAFTGCATLGLTHSLLLFFLLYGVVGGFGCGMAYIAALTAVLKWFPNARGFGGGLVIMGFGLGSFVYSSLVKPSATFAAISADTQTYTAAQASALADHIPFDVAKYAMDPANVKLFMSLFIYSGLAMAIVGVAAALFITAPSAEFLEETEGERAPQVQIPLRTMLGDARFYVLWSMLFLNVFGGITVLSNIVPIMHEATGLPTPDAAGIYAFLAVFNGLGRLVWGWLSDRISRRVTFAIVLGGQALGFFLLDGTKDTLFVSIAIAILLLCYGGGFGVMPAFNADFFGTKHFGANYGMQLSAWGLAALAGVAFTGVMKNLSGSFVGLMQPVSIMLLVAMLLPMIIESPKRAAHAAQAEALAA